MEQTELARAAAIGRMIPPQIEAPPFPPEPVGRHMARLDRILGSSVALTVTRVRKGQWEARTFDPEQPDARYCSDAGHGDTPGDALSNLVAAVTGQVAVKAA